MESKSTFQPIMDMRMVYIVGWCLEFFNIFIILVDDFVDNGTIRGGEQCWHKLQDVGLLGLTDVSMIEHMAFMLLRKHLKHLECYPEILDLIHECIFKSVCGQLVDLTYAKQNVQTFNMDAYKVMATNKSVYHHIYMPVAVAMHLSGYVIIIMKYYFDNTVRDNFQKYLRNLK